MLEKIFPKEYFEDRRVMLLAAAVAGMSLITVARVLLGVKSYNYKVTIGYTQYGADSFILGEWYTLYEPAVFSFITTVIVVLLSFRLYKIDRNLSFLVLGLQLVVQLFLYIVAASLLDAASIVS